MYVRFIICYIKAELEEEMDSAIKRGRLHEAVKLSDEISKVEVSDRDMTFDLHFLANLIVMYIFFSFHQKFQQQLIATNLSK